VTQVLTLLAFTNDGRKPTPLPKGNKGTVLGSRVPVPTECKYCGCK